MGDPDRIGKLFETIRARYIEQVEGSPNNFTRHNHS
jgi:hypothetical protein